MLVPISWLKEYVDIDGISPDVLAEKLTMTGSNVESVDEMGAEISNVVTGKILSIEKHPNADKLVVTKVDVGNNVLQIVTGADNIRQGDIVPIALHGSTLPGGVKIKKGKLRGEQSEGMMCSIQELGLDPEDYPEAVQHGIMIIEDKCDLGMDIREILGLNETIIDFEITSNRPDCLSMIGMAREVAATFDRSLKLPEININETQDNIQNYIEITVEDGELCPRYAARLIKNINIAPSPKWLKRRLLAAGVRPINNIVDITNYVMLEYGQPLHAFDFEKLSQRQIIVRRAKEGERFKTLDDKMRTLNSDMLVIADGETPLALAGIMGGEDSQVTDDTKVILLESANFAGPIIRRASKKLGLRTEASARFEKGLDEENVINALNRAAQLIDEMGAGEVVSGIIDCYKKPAIDRELKLNTSKINRLLGTDIGQKEMIDIFRRIGFEIVLSEDIKIKIPSYRKDIKNDADLAEEVARIYGYDKIKPTMLRSETTLGGKNMFQRIIDAVKGMMVNQGFYETATFSFYGPNVFDKIMLPDDSKLRKAVRIKNPMGEDQSIMRTTLIPSMMNVLSLNYSRRVERACLFELNSVYIAEQLPISELPDEKKMLCIGAYGEDIDFFNIKGICELLVDELGLKKIVKIDRGHHPSFHPGRCANILIKDEIAGVIGEVHPEVADNYEIDKRVYIAEIDFRLMQENADLNKKYKPLPKYPSVDRDIAVIVQEDVPVKQIQDIILKYGGGKIDQIDLFDVYKGKQIEENNKSVAFSIKYRDENKTLTDDEVSGIHNKIIERLKQEINARLR
ncbi:MAG: phenylalanine--tRNA ligase subunit beta [Clostridia bacterium]|nr:phenylalanine--tRNA ligase subunit beta [Clostridia bacterium]